MAKRLRRGHRRKETKVAHKLFGVTPIRSVEPAEEDDMTQRNEDVIQRWQDIVTAMEEAVKGMSDAQLDLRIKGEGWSTREFVHHIVESNMVASNIVLAALARKDVAYDWSWVIPNLAWAQRMGYRHVP